MRGIADLMIGARKPPPAKPPPNPRANASAASTAVNAVKVAAVAKTIMVLRNIGISFGRDHPIDENINSFGLIAVSALLLWQAIERLLHPVPVQGVVPIIVGLSAAAANWMVARLLLKPARNNAAIRLAYIHNMGDMWVSLAPVVAGLLSLTGYAFFDPLIAGGVAVWFIASTGREVFQSHEELIWPEKIVCGHADHDDAAVTAN
jgi:cobalt-zinc-cadmium efflux system protein